MVQVLIESDLVSTTKEFPSNVTLQELCGKLNTITGVEPHDMKLKISYTGSKRKDEIVVPNQSNNESQVLSSGIDGCVVERIIVEDTNISSVANQLKNSSVEDDDVAFKFSEEEYASKTDSVLQWKKANQFGRFDPEYLAKKDEEKKVHNVKLSELELDQRCSVKTEDQPERRGWLRFIGKIPSISKYDIWCGIEFDEPSGKNNGSYKGEIYFGPVADKYGAFVKPKFVQTGKQFEPLEIDFDDSDDEI